MQHEEEINPVTKINVLPGTAPPVSEKIITPEEAPISAAELERRISFLLDAVSDLLTNTLDLQRMAITNQEAVFSRKREISEQIEMLESEVNFLMIHKQAEDLKKHQVSN
ncbi:hypothetical protein [Xylella fastidiosa]|uniref:hypothetical protein n=1 Tax=Xylella fastidiosa TaxID=2371 RepID=UPI000B513945|nr:hypothetical protein [Xylella fastidiosa]QPB73243.1 hypothetical protein XFC3_13200 [Xylella fastidiosa]